MAVLNRRNTLVALTFGVVLVLLLSGSAQAVAQPLDDRDGTFAGFGLLMNLDRIGETLASAPSTGVCARVGTFLTPRVMVAAEIDVPGEIGLVRHTFAVGNNGSIATDSEQGRRSLSESVLVGFRTRRRGRVNLEYWGGASFFQFKAHYKSVTTAYFGTTMTDIESLTHTAGPVIGLDANVAVTGHLAVVPFLRAHGALQGVILRSGATLQWRF